MNVTENFAVYNPYEDVYKRQAYYRMGFEKECDLVSDIGGGYVMDDYKMSLAV